VNGKKGLTALAIALATTMSGCVVFQGPVRVKQVGGKPKAAVSFKLCNSDGESPEPRCPNFGNSDDDGLSGAANPGEEVLLGFRVPRGTDLPARIRSRTQSVSGAFEPLPQYASELNALAPKPKGHRWFGYSAPAISGDGEGNDFARPDAARFKVVMRVPDRLVGKKFGVRPVVGWYDDHDIQGGLDCGPNPFAEFNDGEDEDTICIDSPTRRQTRGSIETKID
jgi:hypothetical protein